MPKRPGKSQGAAGGESTSHARGYQTKKVLLVRLTSRIGLPTALFPAPGEHAAYCLPALERQALRFQDATWQKQLTSPTVASSVHTQHPQRLCLLASSRVTSIITFLKTLKVSSCREGLCSKAKENEGISVMEHSMLFGVLYCPLGRL